MSIIEFKDVWEIYRIKFIIEGKVSWDNFWALRNIAFEVEQGDTLGIIGENGAGKSTLLKLIAGILKPDRGEIKVQGKVSGLMELGAGFQPELTGKENVYLNAGLFGLKQLQIEEKYDDIVNFASIGKFIHAPVKAYSQGMFVRLAFSIAIHMNPDILLIDDILSVGDEYFQGKCIKKIFELKEQGKTIIAVTHDMNMLRRICKRSILLKEGRIVKSDVTDKVIPLYTQMVGVKEGVDVLEKGPLNLVFNNGCFFLSWQDNLLTSNPGAYTAFCVENKWYNSSQADWKVEKKGDNKIIAKGKFYQLALTQIWSIELVDCCEIKWSVEIESQSQLKIQEGCISILLNSEYARWFSSKEKGEFPPIDNNSRDWQELFGGDASMECIGVRANDASSIKLPCLVFEQFDHKIISQSGILNTDYFVNCRALRYRTLNFENCSADGLNRFIYFSGRIILNISDIDSYLKKLQDEFTLSNKKLKLIFEKGQGILSYNNISLTKSEHISTSLYANGKRYHSRSARWELKKDSAGKLIARGSWQGLPIAQIWEIEMKSDSCFLWKVDMEVYEGINIEEQNFQFMCSEDYQGWYSDYGVGEFPKKFLEDEMDILQRCIPDGPAGLLSQTNKFPDILLEFSKNAGNFVKIFNSSFYHKSRVLRIDKIEPEAKTKFLPGKYSCFAVEANLGKDNRKQRKSSKNSLQAGYLSFNFDKGRGLLFWKGIELTKKLGLYTSIRSQGRWHDSYSKAIWKIEDNSKKKVKTQGKWRYLPITQCWEIELKEDNILEVIIKINVEREIKIDRLQTNIMLLERYSQWITKSKKGFFPDFKLSIDDDWDCVQPLEYNEQYISTAEKIESKDSLPQVIFFPQAVNSDWCLNIVNSDVYHRGRILQYLNTGQRAIKPGEYPYFAGKIIIGEH
ncbi:MAG: ABC transporter ATP-binding protein [Candidatus Omnitrophota bacterium]